ncbi:hypothetical protein ACVHNB_15805 [Streptomyces sp. YJ-C3]
MEQKQPWPGWGDGARQPDEHQITELPGDAPLLSEAARSSILDREINTYVIHGCGSNPELPCKPCSSKATRRTAGCTRS